MKSIATFFWLYLLKPMFLAILIFVMLTITLGIFGYMLYVSMLAGIAGVG